MKLILLLFLVTYVSSLNLYHVNMTYDTLTECNRTQPCDNISNYLCLSEGEYIQFTYDTTEYVGMEGLFYFMYRTHNSSYSIINLFLETNEVEQTLLNTYFSTDQLPHVEYYYLPVIGSNTTMFNISAFFKGMMIDIKNCNQVIDYTYLMVCESCISENVTCGEFLNSCGQYITCESECTNTNPTVSSSSSSPSSFFSSSFFSSSFFSSSFFSSSSSSSPDMFMSQRNIIIIVSLSIAIPIFAVLFIGTMLVVAYVLLKVIHLNIGEEEEEKEEEATYETFGNNTEFEDIEDIKDRTLSTPFAPNNIYDHTPSIPSAPNNIYDHTPSAP